MSLQPNYHHPERCLSALAAWCRLTLARGAP